MRRNIPSRILACGCVGSNVKMFLNDGDGRGYFPNYHSSAFKNYSNPENPSRTHLTSVLHQSTFEKF